MSNCVEIFFFEISHYPINLLCLLEKPHKDIMAQNSIKRSIFLKILFTGYAFFYLRIPVHSKYKKYGRF